MCIRDSKDRTFDIVVNTGLIQYLEDPSNTVGEMWRIMKPGSMAIIEVPWKHGPYNSSIIRHALTSKENENKEPINKTFTKKELSAIFSDFKKIKMQIFFMNVIYGIFEKP